MKKIYSKVVTHRDHYRSYQKGRKINRLTEKEWGKYYRVIIDSIKEYILTGGFFIMPYNLGFIRILRNKPRYFKKNIHGDTVVQRSLIDYGNSIKLRERKYPDKPKEFFQENWKKTFCVYLNNHTNGYMYQIKHNVDYSTISKVYLTPAYFKFKIETSFKQQLKEYLITNKKIPTYYERNEHWFNYRTHSKKIAAVRKRRKRDSNGEHLGSSETNRD